MRLVSGARFKPLSRFNIVEILDELSSRIAAKIKELVTTQSTFISIEEDSWTRRGRHFSGHDGASEPVTLCCSV